MAPSSRGPIKVGSGYIDIIPKVSSEASQKFRAELVKEMEKAGTQAGQVFGTAVTKGFEGLPKAAATAARKAKQAVEAEGKDSAEVLTAIERDLTRQYGTEAARRFREIRDLEARKQALAEETSTVTQRALRATVQQETEAAAARSRATQATERERVASLRRVAEEAARTARTERAERQRALEDEARVDQQIEATRLRMERESQAAIRETARVRQQAQQEAIRGELAQVAAVRDSLRQQLAATRTTLSQIETSHTSLMTSLSRGYKRTFEGIEKFGTGLSESGHIVTNNLVAPLGLAAAAATTFGVKSADAMISAQTGLRGMGIELKDINSLLTQMSEYGIETPYSVNDMLKYGTRYARANSAHNHKFASTDPVEHAEGSREVAQRSVDMVKMIGDSAAYGGVLDSKMVSDGMYALEVIQDMGRTPLRNLKQLERATGIPGQQIAKLLGFKDRALTKDEIANFKKMDKENGVDREIPTTSEASAQLYAFMADAKHTGGITGEQLIEKLLAHWKDPKLQIEGAAARMGGATVGSRIENMKEQAQFKLGQLFYSEGEDGSYNYTGLGQKIMGHKVTDEKGTRFEGGLLNDAQAIGKDVFPTLKLMVEKFIDSLSRFTKWIKQAAEFLESHPALRDLVIKAAELGAVLGPLAIGAGILLKLVGKAGKLVGTVGSVVAAPVMAAGRGVRGATRIARQTRAGLESRSEGDGFLSGYRQRRIELTGGTGGDDRRVRNEIRELEQQIRQADARTAELRRDLQQLNSTQLRSLISELSGSPRSVEGAAQSAHTELGQARTQGVEALNRATLGGLQRELGDSRQKAVLLTAELQSAAREVTQLDAKSLGALRAEFTQLHAGVNSVYERIGQGTGALSVAGRIGLLDQRSLSSLRAEFTQLHGSVDLVHEKVGQGTGALSVAGRIGLLNQRSLSGLKIEFEQVHGAAESAYLKIGQGTGEGSLAGRIGLLNNRSLKDITEKIEKLSAALMAAHGHANSLDNSIDNIAKKAPGGKPSGNSPSKPETPKKKYATGGVLPGYAPGVDSIPAMLSPGEAILRPEVTAALGPALIHQWNAAARKGQLSRYAGGGIAGRLGFDQIREAIQLSNAFPFASTAAQVMTHAKASDDVGGETQGGMLRVGSNVSKWIGSGVADRFRNMFNFVTTDSWSLLRRVPTGIGQIAGILGGSISPVLGEYFWNDVWKGEGNILQRGKSFLSDTFSTDTLKAVISNLGGGLWESVKSIAGTAKDLVTDPVGTVKEGISGIWDMASAEIDQITDMVQAIKDIYEAPGDYASSVLEDVLSTAEEALPNLDGLFDFSSGSKVEATIPISDLDFRDMLGGKLDPTGDQVTRWRPVVQRVLGELGLSQDYTDLVLSRIKVESGGDPTAVNLWDSNALNPNIGASQGLMQTVPGTFAAYAGPYQYLGMQNGLASIYAGLNYATHRYGAGWPQALAGNKGYWSGTLSASPGLKLVGEQGPELVNFRGGERVHNAGDTRRMLQGKHYEIHIHEAKAEDTTQAVLRAMQYAEVMLAA
ncbi:hypothetical protein ACFY2K_11890 [Kitasatospora sp. NPDC001309]|uniref:hypothetical protein n=1 Tax=Kitasatospora sp. NPDC001309 TaxID=3364013 RepID=UPI00367FD09B